MKSDINREIKKEALLEEVKSYSMPATVVVGLLFLILILLPFVTQDTAQVKGTAYQLSTNQTLEGNKPIMLVKLKSGKVVRAKMLKNHPFRKGVSVTLLEKKSLNGKLSYDLLNYNK